MDKNEETAYNEVEQYLEECNYKKTALKLIQQVYNTNMILEDLKRDDNMQKGDLKNELYKQRKLYFNKIVWKLKKLEVGDIPLDDAIEEFNRAMRLVKTCDEKLKNAEEAITKLVKENGDIVDFQVEE